MSDKPNLTDRKDPLQWWHLYLYYSRTELEVRTRWDMMRNSALARFCYDQWVSLMLKEEGLTETWETMIRNIKVESAENNKDKPNPM